MCCYSTYLLWLFLILSLGTPARGDSGWDDFTDNLATDLAPLISLFGERLTKQYLSESISLLDNFIFALAPLGILTSVVSVVRVCGNSSLRAFVGRAQEGPGEAERELLSCVSETTAEVFNNGGGISRVFGRPRVLEVVVWDDEVSKGAERRSLQIGTLRDAIREEAWYREGYERKDLEEQDIRALDISNLSLNTGIKRRNPGWFYSVASLGCVLQLGVLLYAALTVFLFPADYKKDDKPVAAYAFPLFLIGTILLCTGMFLCAFVIENSSCKHYLRPKKPSMIYWLQPGGQHVGEQVFGAFLDANEGRAAQPTTDIRYIKSTRRPGRKIDHLWVLLTAIITIAGWILQFVGIRGLHASISLAQTGSTVLMAIARTWLRTKRIGSDESRFTSEESRLISFKNWELDCFALRLEGVESFNVCTNFATVNEVIDVPSNISTVTTVAVEPDTSAGPGAKLVQTRARLAELTSGSDHDGQKAWHDLPIRNAAHSLADTISRTMGLLSTWGSITNDLCYFTLKLDCQSRANGVAFNSEETLPIRLERPENMTQWDVNTSELEAVLGLWTWSMLKSNEKWLQSDLWRMVGLQEAEAKAEETFLYFQKWIFSQRGAKLTSSSTTTSFRQLFGFYSGESSEQKNILAVGTCNTLEKMAAQDLYIHFLNSVLEISRWTEDHVDVRPGSRTGFTAQNRRVNELANCFQLANLGSTEDALLCIVPVLRRRNLLPDVAADSSNVLEHIDEYIAHDDWLNAFSMVQWIWLRSEGQAFEGSAFEMGRLCLQAMLHDDPQTRRQGYHQCSMILQSDSQADYLNRLGCGKWVAFQKQHNWWKSFSLQLGWIAWHIANKHPDNADLRRDLESLGAAKTLAITNKTDMSQDEVDRAEDRLLQCLTVAGDGLFPWLRFRVYENTDEKDHLLNTKPRLTNKPVADDQLCYDWVTQNELTALRHWLAVKWAAVGKRFPAVAQQAFVLAATSKSDSAIETLCRHGSNLDASAENASNFTALVELVSRSELEAAQRLVAHGSRFPQDGTVHSLFRQVAANGQLDAAEMLLEHGADVNSRKLRLEPNSRYNPTTALEHACARNDLRTVSFLLQKGADIEKDSWNIGKPLMTAVFNDCDKVAELLLNNGADIDAQSDRHKYTALMTAAGRGALRSMRLLLDRDADTNLRTSYGQSALDLTKWALEYNQQHWNKAKVVDNWGSEELYEAHGSRVEEAIALLKKRGAPSYGGHYEEEALGLPTFWFCR